MGALYILGKPNIASPQRPPVVGPFFISLTCGQDIEVPDLTGTATILINCVPFNGSNPLTMQVYKDGELIPGAGFTYTIVSATDDVFGTYTFVLSTEGCGSTIAVSRILRQGQPFTVLGAISECAISFQTFLMECLLCLE